MMTILALLMATAMSWLFTGWVRRYALSADLMDVPNERSSHVRPTPRGGGVAIVLSFFAALAWLWFRGLAPTSLSLALGGAGLLVAVVGFADDRWQLPARWRFLAHTAAAAWVLWQVWPVPAVPIFGWQLNVPWLVGLLAGVYLVWAVNFFNFMDGIDGIAAGEAITVSLGGAMLAWLALDGADALVPLALAACAAGFLVWNRPPARIFMGDAGSGFLGLAVGTLSIWYGHLAPHLFWAWMVLQGGFMVDATVTLLRRVYRGERASTAHRSHAYQYASRVVGRHGPVSAAYAIVTLCWLTPVAVAVALQWLDGVVGVLVAYLPLVTLAYRWHAGARERQKV